MLQLCSDRASHLTHALQNVSPGNTAAELLQWTTSRNLFHLLRDVMPHTYVFLIFWISYSVRMYPLNMPLSLPILH